MGALLQDEGPWFFTLFSREEPPFLAGSATCSGVARCHVKDRVSNWCAISFSTSGSVTKRVTASRLEARPWYMFSKLAVRPSLKTPACRLLDVMVARRTCASKNIGKERGSPQVKSMLNALGKTGKCHVGVVLFARLDFPVFVEKLPSKQRPGPRPPNRDVSTNRVLISPSVRETKWKFRSNIVSMEFAFFISFFFFFLLSFLFFSFLYFLETGKVKLPPPLPKRACPCFGKCGNLRTVPQFPFAQSTKL